MDRSTLLRVAERAELGLPLHDDDGATLAAGIRAWLAGRFRTLDRALGCARRRGERSNQTVEKIEARNELIRRCAATHFADLSLNGQGRAIATGAARYEVTAWRADRRRPAMPDAYRGKPKEFFYRLCLLGARIPKRSTLLAILAPEAVRRNGPFSSDGDSGTVPITRSEVQDAVKVRRQGERVGHGFE